VREPRRRRRPVSAALGLWFSAATCAAPSSPIRDRRAPRFAALPHRTPPSSIATLNCFSRTEAFHAGSVKFRRLPADVARAGARRLSRSTRAGAAARGAPAGGRRRRDLDRLPISVQAVRRGRDRRGGTARRTSRRASPRELARIEATTGRAISSSASSPRPCATIETTARGGSGSSRRGSSRRSGATRFVAAGGDASRSEALLRRHLGLCFRLAATRRSSSRSRARRWRGSPRAGIRVGKMQVSKRACVLPLPAGSARDARRSRVSRSRATSHQAFVQAAGREAVAASST